MKLNKIYQGNTLKVLKKEIDWCLEHPATNLSKQFQKGFVAGLRQAIFLVNRLESKTKNRRKGK